MSASPGELAARLPDLPRLVETRAMLLSGDCEVLGDAAGGNYVVRSLDTTLAAVVGRPPAGVIREAVGGGAALDLLCAEDVSERTLAALPGWKAGAASIHLQTEDAEPPERPRGCEVRVVAPGERVSLAHVPEELRRELVAARRRAEFAMAFADGHAVSFAYVPWQTEGLCDLSIDTVASYRRRGFAAATVWRLLDHLRPGARRAVWGAMEDNTASLRLAARLGFTPVDRLFVLCKG